MFIKQWFEALAVNLVYADLDSHGVVLHFHRTNVVFNAVVNRVTSRANITGKDTEALRDTVEPGNLVDFLRDFIKQRHETNTQNSLGSYLEVRFTHEVTPSD